MNEFRYVILNVLETLLRMVPLPCRTGVIEIGHPGRQSPVLLTCNYHLTVQRVKRALAGMDCYLLVANSRGVNVWCAATGGLLTHHDVISVLKTSGIEDRVDHRQVILPQLAATGVETRPVRGKAGWHVTWGPVDAKDIPAFVENRGQGTPSMRQVTFGWQQRVEMAIAWAFPVSVVVALALLLFWRAAVLPAVLLTWGLSFLAFLAFPLYARRLGPHRSGARRLAFEHGPIQLALWGLCLLGLLIYGTATRTGLGGWFWRWGLLTLVLVVLVSMDLTGSTSVFKSSHQQDRFYTVALDVTRCKGAGACEQVCPRNCFDLDRLQHKASMPRTARCVQCGACIVQCPFDALSFSNPDGEVISPQTVRRFKLNMMGRRRVGTERES